MYLVTGGAGFIGSHIVTQLVETGAAVRVLDNMSSGAHQNLKHVAASVQLFEGDIRDEAMVREAVAGVDVVFHQAAIPSITRSVADPRTTMVVNATGTLNLLLAARDEGCRRLIFASSSSVYGDNQALPKSETMTPQPLSPYAVSKLNSEQLCAMFTRIYGFETVALRYFNVFGPRQESASQYAAVIPTFLAALRAGMRPIIHDDGEQSRDFTYVDNVVRANLSAAEVPDIAGRVFNIAAGESISVNEILHQLAQMLEVEPQPTYVPPQPGHIRNSLADISAAKAYLGYEVSVPLKVGLKRTVTEMASASSSPE